MKAVKAQISQLHRAIQGLQNQIENLKKQVRGSWALTSPPHPPCLLLLLPSLFQSPIHSLSFLAAGGLLLKALETVGALDLLRYGD